MQKRYYNFLLDRQMSRKEFIIFCLVGIAAMIPVLNIITKLFRSSADNPFSSVEATSGVLGGGAMTVANTNAANGQNIVEFEGTGTTGGGTPTWSEEFETFNLVTPSNTTGLWAAAPNNVRGTNGAKDPAGQSWDANPNQDFGGSVGTLNPFVVGAVTDSTGSSSNGNALTMNCTVATSEQSSAIDGFHRYGAFLQTNGDIKYFTSGNYIEFRALFNGSNSYMWPAIWFYAAEGYNAGNMNSGIYNTAEIDIVEPQQGLYAYTTLWYDGNGSRSLPDGWDPLGTIPNNTWEVYGMDWQEDTITFYHNGTQVAQVTNSTSGTGGSNIPAYFANPGCKMGVRFDYTMFGGETSDTPETLSMSIDYVREYPNFAASQAS
jgi:hypothetical protein